jgi:plastocyanin
MAMRTRALLAGTLAVGVAAVIPVAAAGQETTTTTTPTATTTTPTTATTPTPAVTYTTPVPASATRHEPRRVGKKAASAVTIRDFEFDPADVTISVGDTVTWTNDGPSTHTATANDGEFDSGQLAPGQSYSHTFNQAGTYAYICQIHPNMKGTITVEDTSGGGGGGGRGGNGGGGTGGGTSPGTGSGGTVANTGAGSESVGVDSPGASGSSSNLPVTGSPTLPLVIGGALLLAGGLALRTRRP